MQALIKLDSKVNIMHLDFAEKFGFQVQRINISTQKTDGSKLDIFDIVINTFLVEDKNRRSQFFEKTFLLADLSINIVLKIFFLTLSNVKVNFVD